MTDFLNLENLRSGMNGTPVSPTSDDSEADQDSFAFPLSPAQEEMWNADRKHPGNPAYNAAFRWKLEGPLEPAILERVLNEIVCRHEILRATFRESQGTPVQIIAPRMPIEISTVDLRPLSVEERDMEMDRACALEARQSFDLGLGPLIRAGLLRMEDERWILMVTLHHIVTDGWSIGIIMEEIQKIYSAFAEKRESPLTELPIQYVDYVEWQKERLASAEISQQLAYWKKKLAGYKSLELPPDYPKGASRTTNSAIVSQLLPRQLTNSLKELSNREGCTIFITVLAGYFMLLHRYTGKTDLSVGSPLAGRNQTDLESLIGLFINNVIFRTEITDDSSFPQFLARVRETVWEALANQDVPFQSVVKSLRPAAQSSEPFFGVNFICQREYARASTFVYEFAGVRMSTMPSKSQGSLYPLNFFMVEREMGWRLSLDYNSDLYSEPTALRLLGHLRELLEGVATNPDRLLSEFLPSGEARFAQTLSCSARSLSPVAPKASENDLQDGPGNNSDIYELPASLVQTRFWMLAKIAPENPAFQMPASVRVTGPLSASVLQDSWQRLFNRHESLRTIFAERNGELLQIVMPSFTCSIPLVSIAEVAANQQESQMQKLIREEAQRPFDLLHGPLLRARLLRLATEDHVLVMTIHHTIADAWSINVLTRELWTVYEGLSEGRSPNLPPLTIQYGDVAHWQKEWLASEAAGDEVAFWMKRLDGRLPVLDFPADRSPKKQPDSHGAIETVLLQPDLMQSLKDLSQVKQVTPFVVTLTCFAALLFRYAGQEDILIGSPVANRKSETEPIIGPFAGPVCLRLDLSGNPTLDELLGRVREVVLDALSHADYPFEALLEKIDARSVHGRSPLFQFYFFYQTAFLQPRQLKDLTITPLPTMNVATPFEMQLGLVERSEGVRAQLEYNADLYDGATIQEVLGFYETLLRTMVSQPERRLSDLPIPDRARQKNPQPAMVFEREFTTPRNDVEIRIAQVWTQVLGLERVGIEDDFFELGGNSFLATRALSRICDTFKVDFPLRTFFVKPTIAGLAEEISKAKSAGKHYQSIGKSSHSELSPLSFAQRRLWFLDQLAPGSPVYNIVDVIPLFGRIDTDALRRSVNEVVRRHETLRTTFLEVAGEPFQKISPPSSLDLREVDLRPFEEDQRSAEWVRIAREDGRKPFDLIGTAPLLRLHLVHFTEEQHRLLLTIHHIIADEVSLEVFRRDLEAIYQAYRNGQPSPLDDLPLQYRDFANWQRELLTGEVLEKHLAYWKNEVAGAPAMLPLPTDRPRPPLQSLRGTTETAEFPKELVEGLRSLGREEEATVFMTLVAGFFALLHRYTGQNDILVGTPVAGRTRREVEGLIGFFVNTLVLRAKFTEAPSFRSLLRQVRETTLNAYNEQDLPFEKLIAELAPERHRSHTPLFQVMFSFHNASSQTDNSEANMALARELETGTSKFDLTLALSEVAGKLSGLIEYRTDLFDRQTIQRVFRHLQTLLENAVSHPDSLVSDLPMLTAEEEQHLLKEWNPSPMDCSPQFSIRELFEQRAEKTPKAIALVCGKERLTYQELDNRANQLARYLRQRGVQSESIVAVSLERSIELIVALLAVLKAGGAYLPIDSTYPQERLAMILEDSKPSVLVTEQKLLRDLPHFGGQILCLDRESDAIQSEGKLRLESPVGTENMAYIIYTSGSTGKPKGVIVTHANVVRLLQATEPWFHFNERDVWTLFHSYAFDFSVWEIWGCLLFGGRLVIVPFAVTRSPQDFYKLLASEHVTVLNQTPAAFYQLDQVEEAGYQQPLDLRYVIFGGEALNFANLRHWFKRHGDRTPQLVNMYGITETTVHVTYRPVTLADTEGETRSVIGMPIPDLRFYLLDAKRRPVPQGLAGEIYVGGAGVARGYLNRPELSAERFVSDPFAGRADARMYKSGDLARLLNGGDLEYLGRCDTQVKIRGFRIELGEIEAVLAGHPRIRQAAVLLQQDNMGAKRLIAYVVPTMDKIPPASNLRTFLSRKLPEYMIPADFLSIQEIPLTANGKIAREALLAMSVERLELKKDVTAPRNDVEARLLIIWEKVLGIRPLGVTDDFFDVGGHSLLAVRLFSEIKSEFGVNLPLAILFEAPTIEGLANILQKEEGSVDWSTIVTIQGKGRKTLLFFISGAGGNVIRFHDVSNYLGEDQPVYALQPPGLDGKGAFKTRVEDLAAHFIEEIKKMRPSGPYHLVGYSFGGLVAFEMARQLQAAGEVPGLVVLLDTAEWSYALQVCKSRPIAAHLNLFRKRLRELFLGAERVSYLRRGIQKRVSNTLYSIAKTLGRPLPQSVGTIEDINRFAALHYLPGHYSGCLTLLRTQLEREDLDSELGWGRLANKVEVWEIPGGHYGITYEPHVQVLAARLSECLERNDPLTGKQFLVEP